MLTNIFSKIKLINREEGKLIKDIIQSNGQENNIWKIPNLIFPIAAIILAIISNLLFSNFQADIRSYINIVLNGSLPLIAINQISASGLYVFNFDKKGEQKIKINTTFLRTKLYWGAIAILILSVLFFSFQVIKVPFDNLVIVTILFLVSVFLIYSSTYITRRIFLLQDNLIEKTYDTELREEAKETHGINW